MVQPATSPDKLVLTEADTVPPPQPAEAPPTQAGLSPDDADYAALLEVKALAQRLGGLQRLQHLVNVLAQLQQ
jgi:hypothetical protein